MVEALPFPIVLLPNLVEGHGRENGNLLKVFGFGGLKRRDDPLDTPRRKAKFQIFQFCDVGQI